MAVASSATQLSVASVQGFSIGDNIQVGSDSTSNSILATDSSASTITVGQAIGSSQLINAAVELVNNWQADGSFSNEDLKLPNGIQLSSGTANWTLCFDSRGIANLYNAAGVVNSNLILRLTNSQNNQQRTVTILQGGAVDTSP